MKRNLLLSLFLLPLLAFSQQEVPTVKWYTITEAQELNKGNTQKKVLIDMYTGWCGWCKKMDKETFSNPAIASYLNTYFYPVKFDAETRDTILFKEKKYSNKQEGARATHELAIELLSGKLSYPTIVYLDESMNLISTVPGYMTPRDTEPVLIFFARNIYKVTPYDEFRGYFSSTFLDSSAYKKQAFKWMTFDERTEKNKVTPRPTLIFLTTDWCPECKIMQHTTFTDSLIQDYLGKNFNTVMLNATTKDSIVFNNVTYKNQSKEHPFHDLAVTLLNGRMDFPVMVFMTETGELISPVPGYFSPKNMEPLLHFFSEKTYKTTPWEKFVQEFKSSYK